MPQNIKFTVSNFFIVLSLFFTIWLSYNYKLISLWLHNVFFEEHKYFLVLLQFITYNFLHAWFFHFLFNSFFIYVFWNQLEYYMWKKLYIIFFIFTSFFIWINYLIFSNLNLFNVSWVIIWISWFALALLSYFTILLWEKWIEEYKWWIVAIILNISLGFTGNISFFWHFFWALSWIIFYFLTKNFIRKIKDYKKNLFF